MSHFSQTIALFVFIDLIAMLAGCGTLTRNPVPPKLTAGGDRSRECRTVRAWAGRVSPAMERDFAQSFEQEPPADFPRADDGVVRYPHLALSGGGANGAFGAGFLNGWSTTGSRPVFKIVTGVSTGALMAPFAFLGPRYDAALHEFYTTTTTRDIFAIGSILSILISLLRGDSLADTGPLAALIARHVDAEFGVFGAPGSEAERQFVAAIDRQLETSPNGSVVIYVPGYGATFDQVMILMGSWAHFLSALSIGGDRFLLGLRAPGCGTISPTARAREPSCPTSRGSIVACRRSVARRGALNLVGVQLRLAAARRSPRGAARGVTRARIAEALQRRYRIANAIFVAADIDLQTFARSHLPALVAIIAWRTDGIPVGKRRRAVVRERCSPARRGSDARASRSSRARIWKRSRATSA